MSPEYGLLEEKDYIPTALVNTFHDMKGGDACNGTTFVFER